MASKYRQYAPIALFVYSRPDHTRLTVEALLRNSEAQHSKIFIFSDAAKDDSSVKYVNEVRQYIHQVKGFLEISIVEREFNMGLADSIIDGVSNLCERFGKVIVLEDDLVVSAQFLSFMNAGLERYENEDQVMQIAGYMFPINLKLLNEDSLFLPFISSWGWATWSRAWTKFDIEAQNYDRLRKSSELKKQFDLNGHYPYFKMLESQQKGKTNSWAIRWYLSVFFSDGLTLYPKQTMVENIGFDGTGENCAVSTIHESTIEPKFKVKVFPKEILVTRLLETVINNMPKRKLSLSSITQRIKRIVTF